MEKRILLALAALALLCSASFAFTEESAPSENLIDLLFKKDLKRVGEELVSELMGFCREDFVSLLKTNPNIMSPNTMTVTRYFIAVLEPVYVFALLASGVYMMFLSGSPETRAKVKSLLPGLIAGMVLVLLSSHIFNIVLYLSESAASAVLSQGPDNPMRVLLPEDEGKNPIGYFMGLFENVTWYSSEASFPFLLAAVAVLSALLLVAASRYLVVSLLATIFPLTIFLYVFLPTRTVGKRMMEQTLLWTFMQVVEAIALVSMATLASLISAMVAEGVLALFLLASLLVLIVIPFAFIVFFRDFLPV